MTTAETAWAEAMKYENRHDPYRFFDELRKTPVAQVADKVYVVTGYRELLQLAHDPHVSSDMSKSPISAQPHSRATRCRCRAYAGLWHRAQHHRVRPGQARPGTTPGDAALRTTALAGRHPQYGGRHPGSSAMTAGQGQGQGRQHLRRRRRLRLSGAGGGHLQDPGCAAQGRTHLPRVDLRLHGRHRPGTGCRHRGRARHAWQKGRASMAAMKQYMADLIEGFLKEPGDNVLSKLVSDTDGPDGADGARRGCGQCAAAPDRRS